MSKSSLKIVLKIIAVLTWVSIFAGCYFAYAGFRYADNATNKNQTTIALIVIASGWGINRLGKILKKNFATEDDE